VSKTPSWPRSWANFRLLQLYLHRNAWANLDLLGQLDTFLAAARRRARPEAPGSSAAGGVVALRSSTRAAAPRRAAATRRSGRGTRNGTL
jgi:hypothetical protein